MSELASDASHYAAVVEDEPPELLGRNLRSSAHLLSGATAFFFMSWVFAYFYLRSLNSHGMWKPKGVDAPVGLGTVIAACVVAAAVLIRMGLADHRAARREQWRLKGVLGLALVLVAVILQIVEWATLGFGPASGGYASVFVGWTGFYALFLLGVAFWLETIVATSFRYRKVPHGTAPPGEGAGDHYRTGHDIADPLSLVRPGLESVSFYATFVAGIGVLTWIVLYLI